MFFHHFVRLTIGGVTRGLSQGGQTLLKGAHGPPFGNAIISCQKFTYITYIWACASEGGVQGPLDFEIFSKTSFFS